MSAGGGAGEQWHLWHDIMSVAKKERYDAKRTCPKTNVHITTIKNWESNSCSPDAKNICALADLFHVTTDILLGREHEETISLAGLSAAERKQVLHIIQAYIDTLPKNAADQEE